MSLIFIGVACGALAIVITHRRSLMVVSSALSSQSAPVAIKPTTTAVASYVVPPDNPRYVEIPAIGVVKARVVALGVKKNQIATPGNVYDAGWYKASVKPGQAGAMFIDGHVSSWQARGVFYNLKKLKPGDKVTVTRGDNKTYTYHVNSLKVYQADSVNMGEVLASSDPAKPGLNLMTCTGKVIKGTSDFSQRLVVFTTLLR